MAMIDSYPGALMAERTLLVECISACVTAAQSCTACATTCLSHVEVAGVSSCIRAALDCADVCETTARVLSRQTGYDTNTARILLRACAQACHSSAEECERFAARLDCCSSCAEATRQCRQACERLSAVFA